MPPLKTNNLEGRDRLGHIEDYLTTSSKSDYLNRAQILTNAQGLIAEPFGRAAAASQTIMTNQQQEFTLVGLREGDVVSNISVVMTVNGSSVTLMKMGLYDTSGVKLAGSADVSASAGAGASKIITGAMTTPYTVPADGGYYASVLAVASVTLPTLLRGSVSVVSVQLGSFPRPNAFMGSQADLAATATYAQGSVPFWYGIS
jgi:hypothetical protein